MLEVRAHPFPAWIAATLVVACDLSGGQVPEGASCVGMEPAQGVNDEGKEAYAVGMISAAVLGVFGAGAVV